MTAARVNPTYYGGDLRRDLLEAALELIAREGPSAVSLRSLARRLGVSHAAPANHFPDKAALFTAIATEGFRLLAAAITDATGQAGPDATAGQRFRATGRAYTGFAVAHPAHFAVMWQRDLLHTDDPALAAAADATFALLLAGVHDVQAEGWAAGANSQTVAFLAWSVVHGLAALWLSGSLDHAGRPSTSSPARSAPCSGAAWPPTPVPPTPERSTPMHRHPEPPTRVPPRPADPRLRVGDAERGQVVDQLADHHAAGRLTLAEFEERMGAAWTARTGTELEALVRDLPAPARPAARARPRPLVRLDAPTRTYLAVMALLWLVWLVGGAGYPWPVWPMLGWGIGVAGRHGRAWAR